MDFKALPPQDPDLLLAIKVLQQNGNYGALEAHLLNEIEHLRDKLEVVTEVDAMRKIQGKINGLRWVLDIKAPAML